MGNGLAYLMLAIWPVVCAVMFTRISIERALLWSILGAYMLLPSVTEFDLPLLPAMDKHSIPSVAVLLILFFILRKRPSFIPLHRTTSVLVIAMLLGSVFTVLANTDSIRFFARTDLTPITFEVLAIPGLRLIDTLSALSGMLITLIPFFLARAYLSTDTGLREILIAFVIAGVIYSVPTLIEVAAGPYLHIWVYGFFQHSWELVIEDGRLRPYVFTQHALWLALFFVMAVAASAGMVREASGQTRRIYVAAMIYLVVVLYLCESLASQMYAVLLLPLILLFAPKWQVRVALCCALVGILYPVIRNLGLVPVEWLLAQIEEVNPDRAQSLGYRFLNEDLLLERAAERPVFGWGGWGRNQVHVPETGELLTTADGRWILVFGTFGWFGYIAQMGLVAWPLILIAWHSFKKSTLTLSPVVGALCLMLGFNILDMLLNDTLETTTLLMVGALVGYAERLARHPERKRQFLTNGPIIGGPKTDHNRTVL